ncbi:hypothetical protein J3R82DRAFT_6417 [Butyriboletus roseoflavus]|nr:hypothetical protein J3R82DRAFT_6417 [Butyriboletus roseoflavus]
MDDANKQSSINAATFVSYILPPIILYFVMAVLVVTPQTRVFRMACWPLVVLLALRATFSMDMDMALGHFERKYHNDLANPMLMIVTRSLYWVFPKEPLVRKIRPKNSTPSTLMDALDLAVTERGYGWDWSRRMYFPPETRPSNRTGFVLYATLSAALHALICGTMRMAVRSFYPAGLGSISGGSIFDETLPFHLRYFRSSIITIICSLATYSLLQMAYDVCTVLGILILGQDPAQWPPGFDAPWRSTSLAEFWGRRWHQWLRHTLLDMGGYPLSFIFGRTGLVIGTFLASGVCHQIGLSTVDTTSGPWVLVGFGMMAPGMFAEDAFKQLTGRKVCGLAGWIWTMSWILLWGNVIMDGFVRAGLFDARSFIDGVPPLRTLVERLVDGFRYLVTCGMTIPFVDQTPTTLPDAGTTWNVCSYPYLDKA